MMVSSFHTLYVNRRFLPKALQPSWWRQLGIFLCGTFYLITTVLAVAGSIDKEIQKRRAAAQANAAITAPAPPHVRFAPPTGSV
jgi:hypothetical protein